MQMKIAIISGGTATNDLVPIFDKLTPSVSYILPISDNGGSTSELLRVIGGPAIGDLRSRITRLIPLESEGLKDLLSHRLPKDPKLAKFEWSTIVDGSHDLWLNIDTPVREIVRSYLIHVHTELLKRSRNSTKNFRLELASIGNLFLTGVRLFCGSLDSAVELILRIARVKSTIEVLPCLNTNFTYHISALLQNGEIITGQSQISHPTKQPSKHNSGVDRSGSRSRTLSPYPTPISQTDTHTTESNSSKANLELESETETDPVSSLSVRKDPYIHPPPILNSSPDLKDGADSFQSLYLSSRQNSNNRQNSEHSQHSRHFSHPSFEKIDSQNVIYGTTEVNRVISTSTHECENIEEYQEEETEEEEEEEENEYEFAIPSYTHPELKKSQLYSNKDGTRPLPAPIERIFYISPYGEEIYPVAQSRVVNCLSEAECVIYSIGSLMTSLIPVLILQGVGEAILFEKEKEKTSSKKKKILLLNGSLDRETHTMTALDFLNCISDSLKYSMLMKRKNSADASVDKKQELEINDFVSHLFYIKDSPNIEVEIDEIKKMGIQCIPITPQDNYNDRYDFDDLLSKLEYICCAN